MNKSAIKISGSILGFFTLILYGYYVWNEKEIKLKFRLNPIINSVDRFIEKNGRCPDYTEFQNMTTEHAHFNCNPVIIKKLGGNNKNDYIVGVWRTDWYYCYQSWNKKYFDDINREIYIQ